MAALFVTTIRFEQTEGGAVACSWDTWTPEGVEVPPVREESCCQAAAWAKAGRELLRLAMMMGSCGSPVGSAPSGDAN